MAFPPNLNTIIVTGTYLDVTGKPASGYVTFRTDIPVLDQNGNTVIAGSETSAQLDQNGHFAVQLICTDNTTLNPFNFFYWIRENISGVQRAFALQLPSTLGSSVDISQLAPAIASGIALGGVVDWINVLTFGADPSGLNDSTTAIQNAINSIPNGGGTVYLPTGTFLLNGSAPLTFPRAGISMRGDGYGSSVLKIGASFTGSSAIAFGHANCEVHDLSVQGASSTISSNPACNGIEVLPGSVQTILRNLLIQFVNGWGIEASNDNTHARISHSVYDSLNIFNCAGGFHFQGNQATVGSVLSNLDIATGTDTGPNANLDGFLIEDAFDVLIVNSGIGVGDKGTGHGIHVKGNCANVWVNNTDCGGFPDVPALAGTQCGILVESGTNGRPSLVRFSHGVFQTFGTGAQVNGTARDVNFSFCTFQNNVTHGLVLNGSGDQINVDNCEFAGNGSGASGTNYDLNITGTPNGWVRNCHFNTGIVSTGNPGVQNVVASSGGNVTFDWCEFLGSGGGVSNIFNGLPLKIRNCKNYNPHGSATISVPASGVAAATLHYDAWYYITADPGNSVTIVRNTNGQGGGVGPSVVIPAGQTVPVFVPAVMTITPTWTGNPPTWVVDGV